MLTTEEARKKMCPIKMGNPRLLRSEYKCLGNACPKWVDARWELGYCEKTNASGTKLEECPNGFESVGNIDHRACKKCPHKYGHCGGQ